MTLGAFAARDQVPPEKPGAIRGRPRWPERFGHLVSRHQRSRQQAADRGVAAVLRQELAQQPRRPLAGDPTTVAGNPQRQRHVVERVELLVRAVEAVHRDDRRPELGRQPVGEG